ncbi:hypothetical protein HELRODRAFT_184506 [Helobdella robusta]|nr:hypothetical protein HELRODRAFT_184506 [Helobdella robusta]ESN93271.1 hypothetical protein HELRODRAFT_184506 [Helobdella robusta]
MDSVRSAPVRDNYPMCATWPGSVKLGVKVELKCNANLPKFRYLIAQAGANSLDGSFTICELEAYEPVNKDSLIWKRQAGTYLTGYKMTSLKSRSVMQCVNRCRHSGQCDSINFNVGSLTCQLNKHANGYSPKKLTNNVDWSFYTAYYY